MKINIIGTGNVGWHFTKAFGRLHQVQNVASRTLEGFDPEADVTVLAVPDNAIDSVARKLKGYRGLIVHTSGATPMSVLSDYSERIGVMWPLLSLTAGVPVNYEELPLFIEVSSEIDLQILSELCRGVSKNVEMADSAVRARLHLAAVFANNFTNHVVALGQQLLCEENLNPHYLDMLVKGTIEKLSQGTAREMQTGPACRGDFNTISRQEDLLKEDPQKINVYNALTSSILSMYGHDQMPKTTGINRNTENDSGNTGRDE